MGVHVNVLVLIDKTLRRSASAQPHLPLKHSNPCVLSTVRDHSHSFVSLPIAQETFICNKGLYAYNCKIQPRVEPSTEQCVQAS
jgi:hypothetical protein